MTHLLNYHPKRWHIPLAALILPVMACSAPALPGGYYEAEKLEMAGKYAEAQKRYAQAAAGCKKKRADCAVVAMRAAQMYEKMKEPRKAVAAFLKVARTVGRGLAVGARALYRAAVVLDDLGEVARAERIYWETVDSYPQTIAAADCLKRLVLRYRQQKRLGALLPKLKRRYRRLNKADIAGNLLFEAALILNNDLGSPEAAVTLYLELARSHPDSPLFDDSLWLAAKIRRKQKRFADAILIYNRLLATREDAFGGASYLSEWMDDSQLAIAQIWLMDYKKPKRAQAEFRKVISGFDRSVLRDDAQFWIVLCEVERGRLKEAKSALRTLKRDYPDSRYVRRKAGLEAWFAFRQAARANRSAAACQHWVRLRRLRPRPWLARHAPRLPPWPACASTAGISPRRSGPGSDA